MRQLRREKEVKEAARKEELSKNGTDSMNQEDSTKATEQRQKLQKMLKETLKKVALKKATEEKGGQQKEQMKITKKKKAGKKRKPNNKEKNIEKESKTKKAATGIKKKTRPQGARVIPEATDGHGCDHKGLLDLKILPSDYLRNYMKVGGWLWNVPCRDCAKGRQGSHNKGDELDLSSRMPKKGKRDMGYYCNCGPVGHEMEDDHPDKAMYTCDLVLCMGCYERRKESMGRTSRRRK